MLRCAITPGTSTPEGAGKLAHRCAELAAGRPYGPAQSGVDFLLIREKHLAAGDLAALSRRIIAAVREAGPHTRVLIAQRVDIAAAVHADGVHLPARHGELTPAQVRRLMPAAYVTISCHSLEEVVGACEAGASAILFGPVFGKTIAGQQVVPALGLEHLHEACIAARPTPVLALGGITEADAPSCLDAGAEGIAAIRLFFYRGAP